MTRMTDSPSRVVDRYELIPLPGQQVSFYGKARVCRLDDGSEVLVSYWTPVVLREPDGKLWRLWNGWSATTGRHVRAFCNLSMREYEDLPYDDVFDRSICG